VIQTQKGAVLKQDSPFLFIMLINSLIQEINGDSKKTTMPLFKTKLAT